MSRINQELLQRIQNKLNVQQAQLYRRIGEIANTRMLDRNLAALVLASEIGINIQKYSTPEQLAELRGVTHSKNAKTEVQSVSIKNAPLKNQKKPKATKKKHDNSVFVVHGRNEPLRKAMFEYLRALGLKPLEWEHAMSKTKGANPYIGDVLDNAMDAVQAVVVMFTPDEEARLKEEFCSKDEKKSEKTPKGQARPNVIFEAGLALGRHPEKTLLVQIGKTRDISDIAGKHMLRLSNDHAKRNDFANRLQKIGCTVDKTGSEWLNVGDFSVE